jgi:hypothetical protein
MKTLLTALILSTVCFGCTTVHYKLQKGDEVRDFVLIRPFYDTKVDKMHVKTPDGAEFDLEGLDSHEKASPLFDKLISKIPNAPIVP